MANTMRADPPPRICLQPRSPPPRLALPTTTTHYSLLTILYVNLNVDILILFHLHTVISFHGNYFALSKRCVTLVQVEWLPSSQ